MCKRVLEISLQASLKWVGCRRGGGKGAAYIKVSEAEIAADYPEPAQYDKVASISVMYPWLQHQDVRMHFPT